MSINIYNKELGRWEKASSVLAASSKVLDMNGFYDSENVEGCLKEVGEDLVNIKKDVKYIYENGTMGGGGGPGGPGYAPVIECTFDQTVFKTDENIVIDYMLTCATTGVFKAHYIVNSSEKIETAAIGPNKWTVGKLARGKYSLKFYVENTTNNLISNIFNFNITVGSLEITSRFNPNQDFSINEPISIPYSVSANTPGEITAIYNINDTETTEVLSGQGPQEWQVGILDKGVHTLSIQVQSGENVSNKLEYNIIISDSDSLFIVTPIKTIETNVDERIIIEYRISVQGQKRFKTYAKLDGKALPVMNTILGKNFWQIGYMAEGTHEATIYVTSEDGTMTSNTITITINVASSGFERISPVYDGMVAWFNADNMNNSQKTGVWPDSSPKKDIYAEIFKLNYNTNGWMNGTLVLNGECYGVIDYQPFLKDVPEGLTFEITCRTRNSGDLDSRVISCEQRERPNIGLFINPLYAGIKASASALNVEFSEDAWTHFAFVVDRSTNHMFVYINGIICKAVIFSDTEDFLHQGKIYLNCRQKEDGTLGQYGTCEIKNIRIYDYTLNHEQVLQNYMSNLTSKEQKDIYLRNYGNSLPEMDFTGNMEGMTEKILKTMRVKYDPKGGKGEKFDLPKCLVGWQGTSSLQYAVKNFRLHLKDEDGDILRMRILPHWQPDDVYTLKANMMDSSQVHNVGLAKFIPTTYTSDQKTPPQRENPEIRTTIDGIPFALYVTDTSKTPAVRQFAGVYTFNIDKKGTSFGLSITNPLHEAYIGDSNDDEGAVSFKKWDNQSITEGFEVIHPDVDDKTYHPALSKLIMWVANTTDGDFKRELPQYFDVNFLLDYFLTVLMFGMVDSLGKNMTLRTWDGIKWYTTFYDMDTMLGMNNSGAYIIRPSVMLKHEIFSPFVEDKQDQFNNAGSLLWDKVMRTCNTELLARYTTLRESYFRTDRILDTFRNEIMLPIGELHYNKDAYVKYLQWRDTYLDMCNGNRLEQITRWINERIIFLDTHFKYGENYTSSMMIRTAKHEDITFSVKTYSPAMITIDFGSLANTYTKLCEADRWTEYRGLVTSKDREILTYGAKNIVALKGLKDLDLTRIEIMNATRLLELDCSFSPSLTALRLSANTKLQTLNCSHCELLGTEDTARTIDLTQCISLKYLDCSYTQLTGVFLGEGGSLKDINLSNTKITTCQVKNQEFLDNINLSNCYELTKITLESCNRLKKIVMPGTSITSFEISDCAELEEIDLAYTPTLTNLVISKCPKLKKINILGANLKNPAGGKVELNLSEFPLIEELNIAQCTTLDQIRFSADCTTLKSLEAGNCGLSAIGFGKNMGVDTVDLGRFKLDYVNFRNCPRIKQILNLTYSASNNTDLFKDCGVLSRVTGTMSFTGTMSSTFFGCRLLTEIPTLELKNVNHISDIFNGCEKIGFDAVTKVFSSLKEIQSISGLFINCKSLNGQIPDRLLENCTKLKTFYNCFSECSALESTIPADLFSYSPLLDDIAGIFSGCKSLHGNIPANLLANNPLITKTENMFYGCSQLTGEFPQTLFPIQSSTNKARIINAKNMFSGCNGLTGSLSGDLFKGCEFLKYADGFVTNCSGLTGQIPATLFAEAPNLMSINGFFKGCSGLTGQIPVALFKNATQIMDLTRCFAECHNLTGAIPVDIFKGLGGVTNISECFRECTSLTGAIPELMLQDMTKLSFANHLFSGCSGLITNIPEKLFSTNVELLEARGVFYRVTGLTGTIPENLFASLKKVTHLSNFFEECNNLIATIPGTLFANCTNLIDISYFFSTCTSLFGTIPETLFTACSKLKEINSFFYGCNKITGSIPSTLLRENRSITNVSFLFCGCNLNGSIPGNLFSNCKEIADATSLFHSTSGLTGPIPSNLFANNPLITSFNSTFRGCNKLTSLPPTLFDTAKNVTTFESTFHDCSGLTGDPIPLWDTHGKVTHSTACYRNCIALTGYDNIRPTWK